MNPLLLTSYDLVLQTNGIDYNFLTDQDIIYNAAFTYVDEFFPGWPFAKQVRLFGLQPADKKAKLPGIDPRMGPTIAKIINEKFSQDSDYIILYVCATQDKKELVRLRKFDKFFEEHNTDERFTKTKITDLQTNIHGAVIYQTRNPAGRDIDTAALALPTLFI